MWGQLGALGGTLVVDALVWRVQVGFMHKCSALVGMAPRLGSAGTVECGPYLWPLRHGGLRIVSLFPWLPEFQKTKIESRKPFLT